MFFLQKLISISLLSPVPFIVILFLIGISNMRDRKYKSGFLLFLISGTIYLFSCEFFADPIILNLEKKYPVISEENISEGEVYILLGGGILTDTAGGNVPAKNVYPRILETAKLYNKSPKKIFISGEALFRTNKVKAQFIKKNCFLLEFPKKIF